MPFKFFLKKTFSNERTLQISESDLRSLKKLVRKTIVFSIVIIAG